MDSLVLIRAADALRVSAVGARLSECVLEATRRLRLVFKAPDGLPRTILISTHPAAPWIGRPWRGRGKRPFIRPDAFTAAIGRRLGGAKLVALDHRPGERSVSLRFSTGDCLVAELQPHRTQLLLVGPDGLIQLLAGRGRSRVERWAVGTEYRPPALPDGVANIFKADPDELGELFAAEEPAAIARSIVGLDLAAVRYIQHSASRAGRALVAFLSERLEQLRAGEIDPVVERIDGDGNPAIRPWPSDDSLEGWQENDAAATVARFYGVAEEETLERGRLGALIALLKRQVARLGHADGRIEADLAGFADPERHRLQAEALLAGLSQAVRTPDGWRVPDPYHAEGSWLSIPGSKGLSVSEAAEACFARYRRHRRGYEAASRRRDEVRRRRERLLQLLEVADETGLEADLLEEKMRAEGIPVGLVRTGSRAAATSMARLEGVRLFQTEEGAQVLVGKSGRDNHRLTFRLAAPEDFWLHALGVPGAHVIIRNADRTSIPPDSTLTEAAQAAAYFSDSRAQAWVDVQWTRRKYVRKIRGAAPGTVRVKKASTVRVRPLCPDQLLSR